MAKKTLATILWFFTGWTLGAMAALALSTTPLVGPAVGVLAAVAVGLNPAGLIWHRSQHQVQTSPRRVQT